MLPLWNCPIRTRLLTTAVGKPSDDNALDAMAMLQLFTFKVSANLMAELLQSEYPLPAIRAIFSEDEAGRLRWREELMPLSRLPRVDGEIASNIVSGIWRESEPRGRFPYWLHQWNELWTEYGLYDQLPGDVRLRIDVLCQRLASHPDVLEVVPVDWGAQAGLQPINWCWDRALQLLSLRGIMALGWYNVHQLLPILERCLHDFDETDKHKTVLESLATIERFITQPGGSSDWAEQLATLPAIGLGEQLSDADPGTINSDRYACSVANRVFLAARHIGSYLRSPDSGYLEAVIYQIAPVADVCSGQDFLSLLELDSQRLPSLGDPIDVSAFGR